ncbi:MAG: SagB/ThcOx family dehydrogenase [Methanocalculus sp. MSAO_Arc1]|uniref:SagB/ThcOx family dehydrogenase n=1 Tax=Methanocalculus TaxID=71151 RepID=UPI000FEE1439|nr:MULTISPECIES: SagB/ThcOx family dehydrogenase [unclassified Methanocalculus]MCP1661716.1 SagB-type dehydrogenase family enzyme [Methanocalculus sp. AMF5]RQD80768.1 MAG: SagB/ThcOx family dehydrogenase [Methanocalculus sp. MSAO_Arc1]
MQRIGKTFMELTRYEHLTPADQHMGVEPPPLEKPFSLQNTIIPLPEADELTVPALDLREAIERRESVRVYRKDPLSKEELAYLLHSTQGIREVADPWFTKRTVPSAGGRHAFETYLLINRVKGIDPGLYRYLAFSNRLIAVDTSPGIIDRATAACLGQSFVKASAVTFIWGCLLYRMSWRYSERAYRLVHLDAGHVCQNLYLAAEQIDCGVCAIGAFDDAMIADLIQADGTNEFVIYCATVGKKKEGDNR